MILPLLPLCQKRRQLSILPTFFLKAPKGIRMALRRYYELQIIFRSLFYHEVLENTFFQELSIFIRVITLYILRPSLIGDCAVSKLGN